MHKGDIRLPLGANGDVTAVPPARYFALPCDYDGTIAHSGVVSDSNLRAWKKLKVSGRKLIWVTARFAAALQRLFPSFSVFPRIGGENGAVLSRPETDQIKLLAEPPPAAFIET